MTRDEVQIITEGGRTRTVRPADARPGQSLAEFLDAKGFPLNMRCAGRGLCRGCQVEIDGRLRRACQCTPAEVAAWSPWRIPENSRQDHSLHGVSVFEIRTAMPEPEGEGIGLAIDVGTTTVAAALWDLSTGLCLGHLSRANAQARFGDNVLSRIGFAEDHEDGCARLQQALVRDCLNPMIADLCARTGVDPGAIVTGTAAGNPIMLHGLAGASLAGFARFPFHPEFLESRTEESAGLGFSASFPLTLLPSAGPFVGADIMAGAFAAGLGDQDGAVLLIDFGTNGEILLRTGDHWLATATAAGPAFEGGRLNCGAAVRDGVITDIEWTGEAWKCRLHGDGDVARGIAGSAYVDFMAQGLKHGFINMFGRFDRSHPAVRERDEDWAILLSGDIYITEADVAELMQAKAAIGGGVMTLLEEAGVRPEQLDTVFVAGGFGYHLVPAHAVATGLLPDVPLERIEMIGNASLGGASLCLHSRCAQAVQKLAANCRTVELNQIRSFSDHFTDALCLQAMS